MGEVEEIEVGEYVRTKQGYLGKYQKSVEGFDEFVDNEGFFSLNIEDVVKHSKNIIDLIEVGDYVNGSKVDSIEDDYITTEFCEHLSVTRLDYEIKSIVTKEQFKSVEYRLED